jgi:fructose-1,6-bisphosphatase/inositol monophosphatase family enzyme
VSDLVADDAATAVLLGAGLGVLSEESGGQRLDRALVAVVDPVDGSTNAHRGLPWYATSICVVDDRGPRVAFVRNLATGATWLASRGGGARREGREGRLRASRCVDLGAAVVGLSGYPAHHLGWAQYRALGAAALDLCAVAEGTLDAYADATAGEHGLWDYAGGWLICQEAGAVVADADGRDLGPLDHAARRAPVAAATPELLDQLVAARRAARQEGGR